MESLAGLERNLNLNYHRAMDVDHVDKVISFLHQHPDPNDPAIAKELTFLHIKKLTKTISNGIHGATFSANKTWMTPETMEIAVNYAQKGMDMMSGNALARSRSSLRTAYAHLCTHIAQFMELQASLTNNPALMKDSYAAFKAALPSLQKYDARKLESYFYSRGVSARKVAEISKEPKYFLRALHDFKKCRELCKDKFPRLASDAKLNISRAYLLLADQVPARAEQYASLSFEHGLLAWNELKVHRRDLVTYAIEYLDRSLALMPRESAKLLVPTFKQILVATLPLFHNESETPSRNHFSYALAVLRSLDEVWQTPAPERLRKTVCVKGKMDSKMQRHIEDEVTDYFAGSSD